MPKKKTQGGEVPQTEQKRYPVPGSELGKTNACPRSTEYDLVPAESRIRGFGFFPDEQTFRVVKKGNCP